MDETSAIPPTPVESTEIPVPPTTVETTETSVPPTTVETTETSVPPTPVETTETPVSASGDGILIRPDMNVAPLPPATISLLDITNAMEVVRIKEEQDKHLLEAIGTLSFDSLKSSLIQWALLGYPNAHVIHSVFISPPSVCSDGVSRTLGDYVLFCSGKMIHEHVQVLQDRVTDITVSFANFGSAIGIIVSRPA